MASGDSDVHTFERHFETRRREAACIAAPGCEGDRFALRIA